MSQSKSRSQGSNRQEHDSRDPVEQRTSIVFVADDYRFLDTMHGTTSSMAYEWLLASDREHLLLLTAPAPLAFVLDMQMQSMNPLHVLELLASLQLPSRVVLAGGDEPALSRARALSENSSLTLIGALPRPLSMSALAGLLSHSGSLTPPHLREIV